MINRVCLTGRITKDVELRKTTTGKSVVSYTLAVQRNQKEADYINCVAWNQTAELMSQHLHKGSLIGVDGRLQTRSYDDQTGKKVYITEVMTDSISFLEKKTTAEPQAESDDLPF